MLPILEARQLIKRYPGVLALDNVDLTIHSGDIHCLVGENGAGKSTLMGILSGAFEPDGGTLLMDGETVAFNSPRAAAQRGIGIIHQDLKLVPSLTVAENIFLGHEPRSGRTPFIDRALLHSRTSALLEQLGEDIDPRWRLSRLSAAQRQIVEIAKALSRQVRVLLLDEPTAALTDREIARLFAVIRRLRADGVAIIYISHRLDEIFTLGDRVTVLRDGRTVQTMNVNETDKRSIIRLMVGRELEEEYPKIVFERGREVLRLENLFAGTLSSINLTIHKREIVGLAGLVGAGRSELARVIFGAEPMQSGRMLLDGKPHAPRSPRQSIDSGVGLLPEDRNRYGLVLSMNTMHNITMANLKEVSSFLIDRTRERQVAEDFAGKLSIKPSDVTVGVQTLSGGNRQKVVLARWLFGSPKVLMFDEPTAGIDVGARHDIYRLIGDLAKTGVGILMISSDLLELLGMCDRIAVMCEGGIAGVLSRNEATQEKILTLATPSGKGITHAA